MKRSKLHRTESLCSCEMKTSAATEENRAQIFLFKGANRSILMDPEKHLQLRRQSFSSNFPNAPDQSFQTSVHARFSWGLIAIKVRMDICIFRIKATGVQNKMNNESSPTLFGVGMFFKSSYHRWEQQHGGTLDWIDFKLLDFFFFSCLSFCNKKIDRF